MPLSSLDSQHTLPENLGSSLEDDDEGVNNNINGGGKNGPSYGRFEGVNGGEDDEDEEEEGEANDDDGEPEDGKTLT